MQAHSQRADSPSATWSGCIRPTSRPSVPSSTASFAGGVATTINALYTAEDIAKQLTDSKAKFLFTVSPLLPQARQLLTWSASRLENVFVLDGAEGHLSLRDLLGDGARAEVSFDPATQLAVLPYSSYHPPDQGVMLTHRNLVANVCQIIP